MEFTKGYTPTILDCFITVLERETSGALAKAPPVIHLTPPLHLFLRQSVLTVYSRNAQISNLTIPMPQAYIPSNPFQLRST